MKIYFKDLTKIDIKEIQDYKISSTKSKKLFSDEGIFVIDNDIYKKELIKDGIVTNKTIGNTELMLDTSDTYYETEYKIPYNHIKVDLTKDVYVLRNKAIIKLNLVYLNDNIYDLYFETDYTFDDYVVKEEIESFIKLLN